MKLKTNVGGLLGGGGAKGMLPPPLSHYGGGLYMYIPVFAFIKLVLNRQIVRFCFVILPEILNGRLCYV